MIVPLPNHQIVFLPSQYLGNQSEGQIKEGDFVPISSRAYLPLPHDTQAFLETF